MFGQVQLLLRHNEVPHVPEYPEHQAEENQQRSGQHKKVPETQRCEDPEEEEDEADDVKNHSQRQEDDGVLPLLHSRGWVRRTGGCRLPAEGLTGLGARLSRKVIPVFWIIVCFT